MVVRSHLADFLLVVRVVIRQVGEGGGCRAVPCRAAGGAIAGNFNEGFDAARLANSLSIVCVARR